MVQQNILDVSLYVIQSVKPVKKRIRYKKPSYVKKYQVKRFKEKTYDQYSESLTKVNAEGKENEFFYDSDEKHIFRTRTLQNIYTKLYFYADLPANATESYINRIKSDKDISLQEAGILCRIEQLESWGIKLHFDEEFGNQAEIIGTEMLPLGDRLKLHIKLLKLLKQGFSLSLTTLVELFKA